MSDEAWRIVATVVGGAVAVLATRWLLGFAYRVFERRHASVDPSAAARRRTTWLFLQRVVLAVVIAGAVLAVLIQFDVTRSVAQALLASSAVIAIFAGLAFNVPLSNLGSGLLVAFSQPLRLGDRVTIGEHTGFVEDISLLYTTLATDLELRVAIPNAQLTDGPIVNRTIEDPRRAVTASFLVPITVDVERALEVLRASTLSVTPLHDQLHVEVGDIVTAAALRIARLDVRAFAPLEADVFALASDIRRAGLAALRAESLLE